MQDRSEIPERGGSGMDWRRSNQDIFNKIPESAGPRLITFRGGAAYSICPPGSHVFAAREHFAAVMLAPAFGIKALLGNDKLQECDADVGAIVINPANVESHVTWSSTRENVVVALTPESLSELALSEFDSSHVELQPPPLGTIDPKALQLAHMLKAELTQNEAPNELYVDSLVTMFGLHILRNYAGVKLPPFNPKGGLSSRSARKVREFLEVNFSCKLSVAELAAISGLSPRHFIEAFTKTFGEPPYKRLLRMRLAFAERLLVTGDLSIAEVAHLCGFSSQSHLTSTMVKYRQTTPKQMRQRK